MIILYEFVDFIEVIQIKMVALYVKVPFDRFCKELHFVSVCLGDFVVVVQCWIVALTLRLEEVLDFAPRLAWIALQANRVAEFSQLACVSTLSLSLTCLGLLSHRTLLDFGVALSSTVLIADTIKSAYLSKSPVDVSPEKSSEPSAASSVDSNTSLSVWSNLYLVWLIDEFPCGEASIETLMGR